MVSWRLLVGDVREQLATLPGGSVQCVGRSFVGIELNPTYAELARKRIGGAAPLFAEAVS